MSQQDVGILISCQNNNKKKGEKNALYVIYSMSWYFHDFIILHGNMLAKKMVAVAEY